MPSQSRSLSVSQLLAAFVSFLLLCGVGGGILAAMAVPFVATGGTATNAISRIFDDVPTEFDFTEPSEVSTILYADGRPMASFYSENRIVVASENISQFIKDAAVSIEDERFYLHNGIDAQGIIGAAVKIITKTGFAGGSTITQQYVKNLLIEKGRIDNDDEAIAAATEQSIGRKLNEARFAIALEKKMTKDEILTGYLNIAQFGPSQYGVESASLYYYGKHASDVTLEQAAMLAGITQAPGRWDPVSNPEEAKTRRDTVLGAMLKNEYITQEQYDAAVAVSIEDMLDVHAANNGCAAAGVSAYFCEYVVKEVLNSPILGETRDERVQKLYRGGLTIKSTVNPAEQDKAYKAVTGEIPNGDPSGLSMALSAVEPGTGKIVAMVQNTSYGDPTEEHPTNTKVNLNVGENMGGGSGFQPGSTFKIFTLIEWIKSGRSVYERVDSRGSQVFKPEDWIIPCAPSYIPAGDYKPGNLEALASGSLPVVDLTRLSVNSGYVRMSSELDICKIVQTAADLGVERGTVANEEMAEQLTAKGLKSTAGQPAPLEPVASQVLGANPVTPLSMANALASIAAEGNRCEVHSFTSIEDSNGNVLGENTPSCRQVLDRESARTATSVLQKVVASNGTGWAGQLANGRPAAGKTGTANEDYHAWFTGFTPQLSTAVWVGHKEGNISMFNTTVNGVFNEKIFGSQHPTRTFKAFMDAALEGQPIERFTAPQRRLADMEATRPTTAANDEDTNEQNSPEEAEEQKSSVPNVVGMSEAQAIATLQSAGYRVAVGTDYSTAPKGQIGRQSPTGHAEPGATITLWTSIGPRPN